MEYDFSGLCADQLFILEKRLESFKKACLKEYVMALNVVNNPDEQEHRGETKVELDDIFNDASKRAQLVYTEAMNKVQRVLSKYL
jgi:hypothetical protein